jgi:ATP-dependent Clp protease ATP-binding subunit ClpB
MAMFDGKDDLAKSLKASGVTKADIATVIDSIRCGDSINDPDA